MGNVTWSGNPSYADGLNSTDLNSLASTGIKTSTLTSPQIDNSGSTPDLFIQFEVVLGSLSPSAGATIVVICIPQLSDGTNFATNADGTTTANQVPWINYPHAVVSLRTTTATAQTQQSPPIPLPPGKYNLAVFNRAGVALNAAGNQVKWRKYSESVA